MSMQKKQQLGQRTVKSDHEHEDDIKDDSASAIVPVQLNDLH